MRASSLLKIRNESRALAFDITATARLKIYDDDKEKRMLEAMAAGAAMNTMQGMTAGLGKNIPKLNADLPRQ